MSTSVPPARSDFAQTVPAEAGPPDALQMSEDNPPPVVDREGSTVDLLARPFRDGENRLAEEAVESAIETVVFVRD